MCGHVFVCIPVLFLDVKKIKNGRNTLMMKISNKKILMRKKRVVVVFLSEIVNDELQCSIINETYI
jgi:hypothetical protein